MVIVKIDKGGKLTVAASGYPGGECRKVTAALVGPMNVASDTPTDEAALPERDQRVAEQAPIQENS